MFSWFSLFYFMNKISLPQPGINNFHQKSWFLSVDDIMQKPRSGHQMSSLVSRQCCSQGTSVGRAGKPVYVYSVSIYLSMYIHVYVIYLYIYLFIKNMSSYRQCLISIQQYRVHSVISLPLFATSSHYPQYVCLLEQRHVCITSLPQLPRPRCADPASSCLCSDAQSMMLLFPPFCKCPSHPTWALTPHSSHYDSLSCV